MSSKTKLSGYQAVTVIDESQERSFGGESSWVQAHVIIPGKAGASSSAEESTPVYRDVPFAILFFLQLGVMGYVGTFYGSWGNTSTASNGDGDDSADFAPIIESCKKLIPASIIISFFTSAWTVEFALPRYPVLFVQASLLSSAITTVVMGLALMVAAPGILAVGIALGLTFFMCWYVNRLWVFIPFAAANLKLGVQAISTNWGIYFVALFLGLVNFAWVIFWTYTANGMGIFEGPIDSGDSYYDDAYNARFGFKAFLFILSFYWTGNVFLNITQTTTAGVTGTWCFDKESASTYCSGAVTESLYRSCTSSLGSISFGSLLSGLVTALRQAAQSAQRNARRNRDGGAALLLCVLQCLLSLLEDIIEYFNEWAFIFVGIYGTTYLESGKRVLELFQARGCTAILSNGLALYVLRNVVLFAGLISGLFGYIAGGNSDVEHSRSVSFVVCFVVGLMVSMVMMNTVQGAVKAVLVCYTDHPARLHENHPEGTEQLTNAMALVYPGIAVPVFTTV